MVDIESLKEHVQGVKCPVCGEISEPYVEGIRSCHNNDCGVEKFYDRRKDIEEYTTPTKMKRCTSCGETLTFDLHGRSLCLNLDCLVKQHSMKNTKYDNEKTYNT